ncbi:DUF6221 family protein [Kitasatospora sp. NPDC059408]|uniref:DUF6221 family protein n=1 Tax=Kitasatospora sp. NPDC059408 TaxID=3346823 RepID=UPI0036851A89
MSALVTWLRAELDRVEQIARTAAIANGPTWTHNPEDRWLVEGKDRPVIYDEGSPTNEQARHIALWDPQTVLRRVAADRQILDEHQVDVRDRPSFVLNTGTVSCCSTCWGETWPCRTVRLLAEGYGWEEGL